MTRNGAIKWAKEIEALKEGKIIQVLNKYDGTFEDTDFPEFFEDGVYRIKPESKIDTATKEILKCLHISDAYDVEIDDIKSVLKEVYGDE